MFGEVQGGNAILGLIKYLDWVMGTSLEVPQSHC